jgi:hypothetical protein
MCEYCEKSKIKKDKFCVDVNLGDNSKMYITDDKLLNVSLENDECKCMKQLYNIFKINYCFNCGEKLGDE